MSDLIGAAMSGDTGNLIKDTTTQNFVEDVITASQEVPVIVDFWAPWCGPCKQLGPAIEKAVTAAAGAVKLVKLNIDEHPEIAQQMRVQSIPAVFAFKDGQPVDGFVGAVPDSEINAFIKRLVGDIGPSPIEQALEQAAAAAESGDLGAAANIFGQILKQDTGNPDALAGLTKCYIERGDLERAKQTLAMVPPEHAQHAAITAAQAALSLAEEVGEVGDVEELRKQVEADPTNHQARFDLALALTGAREHEAAMDELLEIVKRNREWNDQAARKQLVKLFDVMGAADEITIAGRRKLSSILFS
jgi:putative thioredoxin